MTRPSSPLVLDIAAHELARVAAQVHGDRPLVAQQVYINTLCVCAVYDYLSQQGYDIDLLNRDSADPVLQAMMNVADLRLPGLGQVECCPVWDHDDALTIPAEVWSDRAGYIAVQLSPQPEGNLSQPLTLASLRTIHTATLLGYSPVPVAAMPLTALDALDHLMQRLSPLPLPAEPAAAAPAVAKDVVSPLQWLQGIYDETWVAVSQLIDRSNPSMALNFRSSATAQRSSLAALPQRIERGKYITFTPALQPQTQVIVVMGILTDALSEIDICIEVHPGLHQVYLPSELTLTVLNGEGEPVIHVKASDENDLMVLTFSAERGECFSIQINLGTECHREQFQL
jgi:hypothetical protein